MLGGEGTLITDAGRPVCVVVGTGSIGRRHLQVLRTSGRVRVVAFPMRAQSRPEFLAAGLPVVQNWTEAKEAGVTHAIIATDTCRHEADIRAALDVGCHVLAEKPSAVDAKTACRSLELAKLSRQGLWIGCCLRFQEALNIFREHLVHIGKVHSIRIECQSYLPDWRPDRPYQDSYSAHRHQGGVLRDLIHEIDYAGWLFGWADAVMAKVRATQRLGIAAEDVADLLWETHAGAVVSITLDYLSRPARRRMRASGEFGTLEWDGIAGRVMLSLANEPPHEITTTQTRDEMYLAQDLAFIESTSGVHVPDARLATGADGVRALAICDAARVASETKCETKVSYPADL